MVIQKNLPAIQTLNARQTQQKKLSKALEQLSSGYRINSAADDAAGLGVSQKMRAQIFEMSKCEMNVSQGIGVAQTADGALAEVSEMLRRVKELCVAAANGIYGMDERGAITNEVNQIIEEAERIFSGTVYNDINLFRYAGSLIDDPVVSKIYNEMVNPLGPTQLVEWGDLDLVGGQSKLFDFAVAPSRATATIAFAADVNMSDAGTLAGKTISIRGSDYTFYKTGTSGTPIFGTAIEINAADTVEDVMKRVVARRGSSDLTGASVTGNKVTFTFGVTSYTQTINGAMYPVSGADGSYYNGSVVSSTDGVGLKQVDGAGNTNNSVKYSDEIVESFSINLAGGSLTADMITDMTDQKDSSGTLLRQGNSLSIAGKTIRFTTTGESGKVAIHPGMTTQQLRDAIVAAVGTGNTVASAGTGAGEIVVTVKNCSTTSERNAQVIENTTYERIPPKTGPDIPVPGLAGVTTTQTQTATNENVAAYKVTLPSDLTSQDSFAINIQGYNFVFYKKDEFPVDTTQYSELRSNAYSMIDIQGKSDAQVKDAIVSAMRSRLSGTANVSLAADGSVTVLGNAFNNNFYCSVGSASGAKLYQYKPSYDKPTDRHLGFSGKYLQQERSVSFQVPTSGDFSSLDGAGFYSNIAGSSYLEFDLDGVKSYPSATTVNLAGVSTLADFVTAMQTAVGSAVTVTADAAGKITLSRKLSSYTESGFTDGIAARDGAFSTAGTSASVRASGGGLMSQPQTTLDFSSVTAENRDELLGKGFRVTCATCVGEYINVVFVHDKTNAQIPPSFEVTDPVTNVVRTIRNYAVELKDVTDGASIVADLVRQLSPNLKHFTDVAVGNPPSTLVLKDKRMGDITAAGGGIARAEVLAGVFTNFTYDLTIEEVRKSDTVAPPRTAGGTEMIYRNMLIYAGSEPNHQWIPIHLPYLTAAGLNLEEPEDIEDAEDAMDLMERVHEAQEVISTARGRLGADQNRLEHTFNAIVNTNQQIQAAESRIRDADMAKVMAKFVAQSVLGEAQQSMLAHANQNLQLATKLLE